MHCSDKKSKKRNKPQYILNICIALFAVICALPILLVFIASFSTEESILTKGFSYFPSGWTLNAYKYIATFSGQLVNSYAVSIYEVVCGTALTLLLCSMFGYVLTKKDFVLTRRFLRQYHILLPLLCAILDLFNASNLLLALPSPIMPSSFLIHLPLY